MTSRERVIAAINHHQPDRVPIDLGGTRRASTSSPTRTPGPPGHPRGDRHARPGPAARPAVRGGAAAVPRRYALHRRRGARQFQGRHRAEPARRPAVARPDRRVRRRLVDARRSAATTWTSRTIRWPRPRSTDLADYPFPKGDDPSRFAGLRAARRCGCAARRPTPSCSGISGVVYEICWYLRGLEHWFMDLLTAAGVLRGPARPDAEVLARLVPRVPATRWATWST